MHGALLVNKHEGVSSFGIVELLQKQLRAKLGIKRKELPRMGHGGTLDPFATGLLVVCVGSGAKLSRYFLGSRKSYEGTIRFGETSASGDRTDPVVERSELIPSSLEQIRAAAQAFCERDYLQTPPMHSAKKKDGVALYELARQGIEVEREPVNCRIHSFEIPTYDPPLATFRVSCSAGTYIRTLAQDLARSLGTVALLDTLHRTGSGLFQVTEAWTVEQIGKAILEEGKSWDELPCWIPFHEMMRGFDRVDATADEARALIEGRQKVLLSLLPRVTHPANSKFEGGTESAPFVIFHEGKLVAIASQLNGVWGLDRVFP